MLKHFNREILRHAKPTYIHNAQSEQRALRLKLLLCLAQASHQDVWGNLFRLIFWSKWRDSIVRCFGVDISLIIHEK